MRGIITNWAAWLRGRPDREHEITLNRAVISFAILVFTLFFMPVGDTAFAARAIAVIYLVSASALLAHLIWRPAASPVRRIVAMAVDLVLLSFGLAIGQDSVAILYPFYYWIILGNGFRYGEGYLYSATIVGTLGFLIVILISPYWQSQPLLSGGLLGGVVILPLYAATLIRSLSRAKEAAEQASRAKSAFLTSVSHELRTPLNAIMGSTDLLVDTTLRRDQRDMVDTIRVASSALLSQINDLLDLSSIESGRLQLTPVTFEPLELLAGVRDVGSVQARAKEIDFHLFATARTPSVLTADERRIREVLINLIGNAIKFTEAGSVTLSVDYVRDGETPALLFEVGDTGIGMSEDEQAVIFKRFTQANSSILNRFGGTGLGLAIVWELVDLLRGSITVSSAPGKGSVFRLRIPAEDAGARHPAEHPGGQAGTEHPGGQDGSLMSETKVILLDPLRSYGGVVPGVISRNCGIAVLTETVEHAVTQIVLPAPDEIRHRVVLLADVDRGWPEWIVPREAVEQLGTAAPTGIFGLSRQAGGLPPPPIRELVPSIVGEEHFGEDLMHAMRLIRRATQAASGSHTTIVRREKSLRILLADDNRVNQKVISRILEAGGHHVRIVANGEEALDAMEAGGIDFVLMDLNMPGMDGIEATKLFRMMALGGPHLPIVGLTADATRSASDRAVEAGMDACLTKPVNGAFLLDRIDHLFAEHGTDGMRDSGRITAELKLVSDNAAPASTAEANEHVDLAMLKNLETLGGPAFVSAVISDFLTDGSELLLELREVVAAGDVAGYGEKAHALQSGAGNIGVLRVAESCRGWRPQSSADLLQNGPAMVERIEQDFETARSILLRQHARRPLLISDRDQVN